MPWEQKDNKKTDSKDLQFPGASVKELLFRTPRNEAEMIDEMFLTCVNNAIGREEQVT